jgi:hypothetical protein
MYGQSEFPLWAEAIVIPLKMQKPMTAAASKQSDCLIAKRYSMSFR